MGVYPEPALCADDVSRLVPSEPSEVNSVAATAIRADARTARNGRAVARIDRAVLAGFVVAIALGAGAPAARAHEKGAAVDPSPPSMELFLGDRPAEWGGESLTSREPLTLAVMEHLPGSAPEPRPAADTLRFGDTSVPRPLVRQILQASEATGVDPVYMMALADKESSFDTDVKSSASSAQGLFQFVTGTWLEMIRDYGARHGLVAEAAAVKGRGRAIGVSDDAMRKRVLDLRNDPLVSGLMAGELIKRDRARIESRIGRELKTTELYIAHFLGTASAGKFFSLSAEQPDRSALKVFGRAARANREVFTRKHGGKRYNLSVAEVHQRLDGMIDRRIGRYQAIAAMLGQPSKEVNVGWGDDRPVLDARLRLEDDVVPPVVAPTVQ